MHRVALNTVIGVLLVLIGSRQQLAAPVEIPNPMSEQFEDDICGSHPLKKIVDKIKFAKPNIDQAGLVEFIAKIKHSMPHVWQAYESSLSAYQNCKIMSAGGSLG